MDHFVITRADSTTYVIPGESPRSKIISAEQRKELLGEDVVEMTLESVGYINFSIGDSLTIYGEDYHLNALGEPERMGDNLFKYSLTFESDKYELTKVIYRNADTLGFNPSSQFSLTGNLDTFLTVLQYNLNRVFGSGVWAIGAFPSDSEAKTLSFDSENALLLLNRLCVEYETEYEIETIEGIKTIHLRKAGSTLPITMEYGRGNGLYTLSRRNVDQNNIVTRLYVEGSNRNIKAGYRDNALRLRLGINPESYIDSPQAGSFGIIEGAVIFEDIFPRRIGTISHIGADKLTFRDTSMDFDLNEKDVEGLSAKIHFNTGNLAGYAFEITSYNHSTKTFVVKAFEDERGLQFPGDSPAFKFSVGDKYVLLDINMPTSYVTAAEAELLERGQEYLSQNDQPRVEYDLTLDSLYLKDTYGIGGTIPNILQAGDYIHVKDTHIGVDKEIRVKGFSRSVADPFEYTVTLSDVSEPTRIERLISTAVEAGRAVRLNRLHDPARARRNWRDIEEVTTMIDTLRAEMALIGTPEGQFQTDSYFLPNKNGNPNLFGASAGLLIHNVYEQPGEWGMGALETTLTQNQPYFLYAKCSRTAGTGIYLLSLTRIEVDSDPEHYHFPVGVLSSVSSNARVLTTTHGYTFISGNNITTGIIQNDASGIFINLQTGEIRGNFTFTNGKTVENEVNARNARHFGGTDPAAEWATVAEKRNHVNDIWAKTVDDGTEEYVYMEVTTDTFEWVVNQTLISGGRIVTGTIQAEHIDVRGLFAEEIVATNFTLGRGKVGAFEVDNVLRSVSGDKGIYINPAEFHITIDSKTEGKVSAVRMRAGDLEPLANLFGGTGTSFGATATSTNYVSISRTSDQLRGSGGVNFTTYIGRAFDSGTQPQIFASIPTDNYRFALSAGKNYAIDLRYLFAIQHSGESANGRTHKLQGALSVAITATLKGVTAGGATKNLIAPKLYNIYLTRSDNSIIYDEHPMTIKTSIYNPDCVFAYWQFEVNLQGDLTYQRWTSSLGGKYWSTYTGWEIEFRNKAGMGTSLYPSVGVTEITTAGFQAVWATNRYFRIDGNDPNALIRSAGVWMHNGVSIATINDVAEAIPDLTPYATWYDIQQGYYTKTDSDNRYTQKVGDIMTGELHINKYTSTTGTPSLRVGSGSGGNIRFGGDADAIMVIERPGVNTYLRVRTSAHDNMLCFRTDAARVGLFTNAPAVAFHVNTTSIRLGSFSGYMKAASGDLSAVAKIPHTDIDGGAALWSVNDTNVQLSIEGGSNALLNTASITVNWAGVLSVARGGTGRNTLAASKVLVGDGTAAVNAVTNLHWDAEGLRIVHITGDRRPKLEFNRGTVDFGTSGYRDWRISNDSAIFKIASGLSSVITDVMMMRVSGVGILCDPHTSYSLDVNGASRFQGDTLHASNVGSPSFTGGFAGSGWRMDGQRLTVDHLTVRKSMSVYELVINQIRGTNGALWVSDCAKVASVSGNRLTIDTGGSTSLVPFAANDLIRCQKWTGSSVKYYVARVTALGSNYIDVTLVDGSSPYEAGDEIVRMGNTTDANRRGAIYITSSDDNAPFIDVLDGVSSASLSGRTVARLGKLDGITDPDLGSLSGYGLYSSSVYLKGRMVLQSGSDLTAVDAVWPSSQGLEMYLPLDGNTNDYSKNALTVSALGTMPLEYVEGAAGQGINFDSSKAQRLIMDNAPAFTNEMTLAVWLNLHELPSVITGVINNYNVSAPRSGIGVTIDNIGRVVVYYGDGSSSARNITAVSAVVTAGVMQHIAVVVTGPRNIKVYLNGELFHNTNTSYDIILGSHSLCIGRSSKTSSNYPLNGLIDEPRIYSRALSGAEIRGLYKFKAQASVGEAQGATRTTIEGGLVTTGRLVLLDASSVEKAGITGAGSGADIAIWAGQTYANRASAPFRVNYNGQATLVGATVQSAASGQRIVIDSITNTLVFNDSTRNAIEMTTSSGMGLIRSRGRIEVLNSSGNERGGMAGQFGGNEVMLWCGTSYADRANAPLRFNYDGTWRLSWLKGFDITYADILQGTKAVKGIDLRMEYGNAVDMSDMQNKRQRTFALHRTNLSLGQIIVPTFTSSPAGNALDLSGNIQIDSENFVTSGVTYLISKNFPASLNFQYITSPSLNAYPQVHELHRFLGRIIILYNDGAQTWSLVQPIGPTDNGAGAIRTPDNTQNSQINVAPGKTVILQLMARAQNAPHWELYVGAWFWTVIGGTY